MFVLMPADCNRWPPFVQEIRRQLRCVYTQILQYYGETEGGERENERTAKLIFLRCHYHQQVACLPSVLTGSFGGKVLPPKGDFALFRGVRVV